MEVLVVNDDLALEVIQFFLLSFVDLLGHAISRDEDRVEVIGSREGLLRIVNSRHEDWFAFILGSVLILVKSDLGIKGLLYVWVTKSISLSCVGLLWVLVPV